jgi:hypothetical protein
MINIDVSYGFAITRFTLTICLLHSVEYINDDWIMKCAILVPTG